MDVGMLFFDTKNNSIGETLFLDGDKMIGKYYQVNKSFTNLSINGYGEVIDNNKIWGKKHIIDYLNNEINEREKKLKLKNGINEDISKLVSLKIQFFTFKNKNSYIEIDNILKHQEDCFTESRQKQVFCILKNIRRNNKRIKSLNYKTNREKNRTISLKNKIIDLKKLVNLVKTL